MTAEAVNLRWRAHYSRYAAGGHVHSYAVTKQGATGQLTPRTPPFTVTATGKPFPPGVAVRRLFVMGTVQAELHGTSSARSRRSLSVSRRLAMPDTSGGS